MPKSKQSSGTVDPGGMNWTSNATYPDPNKLGSMDWWERPGLQFGPDNSAYAYDNRQGASSSFGISMPDWAPAGVTNYQSLYDLMQGMTPETRAAFIMEQQSQKQAQRDRDEARNRGLAELNNRSGEVNASYQDWQNDPYRMASMDQLKKMSEGGYELIGDAQKEGYNRQLAQGFASQQNRLNAGSAARGTGAGGTAAAQNAQSAGLASAAQVGVNAQVDAANETARRAAIDTMARVGMAHKDIDLKYERALDDLSRMSAAIEAGEEYSPSEFLGYAELSDAMRRADADMAFKMEQLDILSEASQKDIWDWISLGTDTIGTGLWEWVF